MAGADNDAEVTQLAGRAFAAGSIAPGTLLCNGTYRIDERLGAGGMGEVYRGINTVTGAPCAIKTIRQEFVEDKILRSLFVREAEALKSIRDSAVVGYEGVFRDEIGRVLIVMDFVDGPSLAERMHQQPLSVDEVERLARRLVRGLAAAHAVGVHHRDLSPDNILLPGGRLEDAVIIDFGIARREGGGPTMFGAGPGRSFIGKFAYASPEQAGAIDAPLDHRSDLYSLGLVLAAAARGRPLPMGEDPASAIAARKQRPDLSSLPKPLQRLIGPLLTPHPKDRPSSLDATVAGTPATERPERKAPAPRRRVGLLPWLGGGIVAAALGAAAWVLLQEPPPPPEPVAAPPTASSPAAGGSTAPAPTTGPDRLAIAAVLADLPCANVTWSSDAQGGLAITGTLPSAAARQDLLARLAALPDAPRIVDRSTIAPAPQCEAGQRIAALIGTSDLPTPEIVLNRPDRVFHADRDVLVATVHTQADKPLFVYLDFFDQDGKVYHLLPETLAPNNLVQPGGIVQVGHEADAAGARDRVWRLSEPFGRGRLVAIASERPLYAGLRDIGEDASTYLAFLAKAVPQVALAGAMTVSEVEIETRPGR